MNKATLTTPVCVVAVLLAALAFWLVSAFRPGRPAAVDDTPGALTLVYTAETNGFLQDCGCVAGQVGGLSRRATLIKRLQDTGGVVVLVDGGNLAMNLQRAQAVLDSIKLMGYRAVGLGELEVALGKDFVSAANTRGVPLTACPPEGPADSVAPYILAHYGRRTVAVVSASKVPPEKLFPALKAHLARLRGQADLVVVLSQLDSDTEGGLTGPDVTPGLIDLLIGLRGDPNRQAVTRAGVTVVPVTQKGEVGIVDVTFDGAGRPSFAHRFETVTDRLPADAEVQRAVSTYYNREARQLLEASLASALDGENLKYEPVHRCADCHATQVRLWQESKHAHAAQTLRKKERLVPECLQCHSELFRQTQRFNPSVRAAWHGVECATCHGDGVLHSALRDKESITRRVDESTCRSCHNPENDPKFDFETYLERIRHW